MTIVLCETTLDIVQYTDFFGLSGFVDQRFCNADASIAKICTRDKKLENS